MKNRFDDHMDPFEDDLDTFLNDYQEDVPDPKPSEDDESERMLVLSPRGNMFRTLRADEIDVRLMGFRRLGSKVEARLYLYQKARVPAVILDETVGPLNWKVSYGSDISRCTISIYDSFKQCWVSKENVGDESDLETEKTKSTASDAFKRAASYWGIGRELYTAGDIITDKLKITNNNKQGYDNPAFYRCYDKFEVSEIECNKYKQITHLVIRNVTQDCIAYKK